MRAGQSWRGGEPNPLAKCGEPLQVRGAVLSHKALPVRDLKQKEAQGLVTA